MFAINYNQNKHLIKTYISIYHYFIHHDRTITQFQTY